MWKKKSVYSTILQSMEYGLLHGSVKQADIESVERSAFSQWKLPEKWLSSETLSSGTGLGACWRCLLWVDVDQLTTAASLPAPSFSDSIALSSYRRIRGRYH